MSIRLERRTAIESTLLLFSTTNPKNCFRLSWLRELDVGLFGQLGKETILLLKESGWGVVFLDVASIQHQNAIRVQDRVETMRDDQTSHAVETFLDHLPDQSIRLQVNVGRRLVQHDQ
ncbi:hypothetical protein Ae201684P_010720 [Aphanomyces euteiches]|uniref:Uncharacterized protein n=1 Tax=Aphanomyces euteiches TaxID=100861 RepID=A0A6G0W3W6_9STRA|nr:hypothetical protein Ae201684_018980 [Aphanomyces euteiches]KAH9076788.1 hypothetical protein Ae201684P_010720 [Aphanomyces euteiches]